MTQICGDAHVRNLGAFEAPDGRLIFDINDFDETMVGPWEWDIKRMCASLVLAGREAGNTDKAVQNGGHSLSSKAIASGCAMFSEMAVIDLARFQIYRVVSPVRSVLRKAERATPEHNLEKLTVFEDGKHRFREHKPLQFHMRRAEATRYCDSLSAYSKTLLAAARALLLAILSRRRRLPRCWYGQRRACAITLCSCLPAQFQIRFSCRSRKNRNPLTRPCSPLAAVPRIRAARHGRPTRHADAV